MWNIFDDVCYVNMGYTRKNLNGNTEYAGVQMDMMLAVDETVTNFSITYPLCCIKFDSQTTVMALVII